MTPLLRQIAEFGRWLTGAILLIVSGTFAHGILVRDYSATDMFLAAVGLATETRVWSKTIALGN